MHHTLATQLARYQATPATRNFLARFDQPMFIDGQPVISATDGATLTIEEPSSGCPLAQVPSASTEDTDRAVAAAKRSFSTGEWASLKPAQRQNLLLKMADTMADNLQTLAEIEALNAGKAISGCKIVDVQGAIDLLRYMAGWATKIEGATREVSLPGDSFSFTQRQPVGVVGAIVPWNWPLSMALWKLAAPLAVGCTVVLKPAEQTPLSLLYLMQLWQQAGLPAGVVNIVTGTGEVVGQRLAQHPDVRKISFTGSTPVGRLVGKEAVDRLAHLTLELGGKSAMVAFEDADIDDIVQAAHQSVFFNAGQVCSAGSRLYVHRAIYSQTVSALARSLDQVVIGDPLDPATTQGPQISARHRDSILRYIRSGIDEGARLVRGGQPVDRAGYYVEPTLFADTDNTMKIVQEEIFGPVLCVQPFDNETQAITLANDNIYGLAASVFTADLSRALRVVKLLEAGNVSVNTHDAVDVSMPFGGTKASGFGKDMGPEQLDYFLETKAVIISLKAAPPLAD